MNITEENIVYKMAFASIAGMGVELGERFLDVLPNEAAFFEMSNRDLEQMVGAKNKILESAYRKRVLEKAKKELDFVAQKKVRILYFKDEDYPKRLLQTPDAPLLLYCYGNSDLNKQRIVSIVGTRKATAYGTKLCDTLVKELVQEIPDIVIVSGLAYGTDINAHRAALRYGATTVAVQACGLNKIYPAAHRNDAIDIVKRGGMIVTDYQSSDVIHRSNFLARNRIIAALSDCTVIIESADRGGSLVTASIAQSYDRDVFAFPGRVGDEYSKGTNRIIMQNNAALFTCANDLLRAMRWETNKRNATENRQLELFPQLDEREQAVMTLLRSTGVDLHVNDIAQRIGLPMYKMMSTLVELDAKGLITTLPGCRYTAN